MRFDNVSMTSYALYKQGLRTYRTEARTELRNILWTLRI